ncbi:hypothetical protein GCK32_019244, partial [Trichostrongylus colubriformis]
RRRCGNRQNHKNNSMAIHLHCSAMFFCTGSAVWSILLVSVAVLETTGSHCK